MASTAPIGGVGGGGGAGGAAGAGAGTVTPPLASAITSTISSDGHASTVPAMFFDPVEERPDGRKYNPQVMSFIRNDWITQQMRDRESEFTEFKTLSVFVGTYNVNGKVPTEDITSWLCDFKKLGAKDVPDIYVVGFQEIVDLNAANVVVTNSGTEKRSQQWQTKIQETLDKAAAGAAMQLVLCKSLVGVLLCVFAKKEHMPHITGVQGTTAGVGILGMMGNKGGAAIRFRYDDSTICFLCSHLAAKRSHVAQRNADFVSILNKVAFEHAERAASAAASTVVVDKGEYGVLDHDLVVWLGDLNYRVAEEVSVDDVNSRVDKGDLEFLRDRDQLNIERAAGRVFQGFHEAPTTFMPTYKYQTGTDLYERRPDKKHRAPAWCDRVLWRSNTGNDSHIQCRVYDRAELKASDHKPVMALLEMRVMTVVRSKREEVYRHIMRRLDKLENESIPKATLDSLVVHYPAVVYKQRATQTVTIKNEGEVVVHYRFVPKFEEHTVCKLWLTMEPMYGMILPGESAPINLHCYVEEATAAAVSHGRETLQDILILRLENGGDYYVTVSGEFQPTAFCSTVGELVQSAGAIRTCPIATARLAACLAGEGPPTSGTGAGAGSGAGGGAGVGAGAGGAGAAGGTAALRIPKELWRLVDFLFKRAMDTPGALVGIGVPDEMVRIREAVDTGASIDTTVSPVSVGATLLELLSSLDEPVVPTELFPHPDFSGSPVATWCSYMLQQLPEPNYTTFVYIVSFARELLAHASTNELTADEVALVFGRALFRPPTAAELDAAEMASAALSTATPVKKSGSSGDAATGTGAASASAAGGGVGPRGGAMSPVQQATVVQLMRHLLRVRQVA